MVHHSVELLLLISMLFLLAIPKFLFNPLGANDEFTCHKLCIHVSANDKFTRHRSWHGLRAVFCCYKPSRGLPFLVDLEQWLDLAWLAFPVFLSRPTAATSR